MIILGLHFGHDAGATILVDGKIVSCVVRERQTRIKHAMTLDTHTISKVLKDANVNTNQIDFCAITSTQGVELIVDDPKEISISLADHMGDTSYRTTMNKPELTFRVFPSLFSEIEQNRSAIYSRKMYSSYFPEYKKYKKKEGQFSGWLDKYVTDAAWLPPKSLQQLSSSQLSSEVKSEFLRHGFHYPATISLQGFNVPAFFINHHACHAASSYYQSGYRKAAILVQDGGNGDGYDSGMFYYAEKNKIYPIAPHHSILGVLYDQVASFMNLGLSAAGKLMGLAAYGEPVFYNSTFLGNWNNLVNLTQQTDLNDVVEYWILHCLELAKSKGYDIDDFGDVSRMTSPINADIAASTQKLFEENTLVLTKILYTYLKRNKIIVDSLCLSGGNALNCPANSRINHEGSFKNVFIEPGCDDSGLAIGAAYNCYFNILNQPLPKKPDPHFASPFLGPQVEESDIKSTLKKFKEQVNFLKISDWENDAARELERNNIISWFCGRSEIGPRALGHRSILADARDVKNWERVNKIKNRELWRPFAPVVLESEAEKWFSESPLPSPYMLFNAVVKSKAIPAVTHVDGTARIQTVNKQDGDFYSLVNEFFRLTKVPVLLNTSFNGPGEPIVETPMDAVKFFVNSELDFLYIDSYKVTRKPSNRRQKTKKRPDEIPAIPPIDVQAFMAELKIKQSGAKPPEIVETYKGYNLIAFQGRILGIKQEIGMVNLAADLSSILQSVSIDNILISPSNDQLRDDIDGFSTTLRIRQEAAIANEQAAARIGLVETGQENLDDSAKHMAEQMANERQAADQALDKLRQEAAIANEQAAARIGLLTSDIAALMKRTDEQEQQTHLIQTNWMMRYSSMFSRICKKIYRGMK